MGKVNNENYYTVQGWMINELDLKGNELSIYAIIYGFTQLNGQKFTQSLQYLADWVNGTKQGVEKNLQRLVDKGLIIKEQLYNSVAYHTTQLQETEKEKKEEKTKKSWIKENKDNKEIDKEKEHNIKKENYIYNNKLLYIKKKEFDNTQNNGIDDLKNQPQESQQLLLSTLETQRTIDTQPARHNLKNYIYIDSKLVLDSIYSLYSKFGYNKRFLRKATETRLTRLVNTVPQSERLNPTQIVLAYSQYLNECYGRKKDFSFVKASSSFLSDMVYTYAEIVRPIAEDKLREKYGENWKQLKFRIKENKNE